MYDRMMVQITKEINDFYVKYAKKEGITMAEAKKRVKKLDIEAYAEKAKKYVKNKDFSDEANDEMRLYNLTMKINRLEMLKAQIGLELVDGFDDLQKYFDEKLTEQTLKEFERQAGILGETVRNNAEYAKVIVNASFYNATFSDRIWMNQTLLKSEISKLLQTGIIQGKNPRVLASELVKKFDVNRRSAERLMITELARVQTEAQKQSLERNGFTEYTFIANGDCCPICAAIDGKHFKVKDMMPGENAAPMHPNCRCSSAPYEDDEEYEEWLDYLDKGGTTEEWNKLKVKTVEKTKRSDIIKTSDTEEGKKMSEIKTLGKLNPTLLEKVFGKIQTDEVIVTDERVAHIQERHPQDYELFVKYGTNSIQNPDYIIKDMKHDGTVFMVKKLQNTNLNVVVRVVLDTDKDGLKNSVMTFYRIRERNLKKLIEKNGLLYKKE